MPFVFQQLHVLADLPIQNLGIVLGRPKVSVAEHLGNGLNRDTVAQGDGGCKGVPGNVKSQVLGNAADVCNFLEITIHFLVAEHRQHQVAGHGLGMVGIPLHDLQSGWKDRDMKGAVCFLSFGVDPLLPIDAGDNLRPAELSDVCIGQSGIAAKEENIPDLG